MYKRKSLFSRERYFWVMNSIAHGPDTRRNITRKLKIGASELHYYIETLIKQGLIRKEHNSEIKRIQFSLTEKGLAAYSTYQEMMQVADKYKSVYGDII